MYATSNGANVPKIDEKEDINKKKILTIAAGVLVPIILFAGMWSFLSADKEIPPPPAKIVKIKKEVEPPAVKFEELPTEIEEVLDVGGVAPQLNKLPPAEFLMGDQQGIGDDNEKPVHKVKIPVGFYLSRYEVTFEQYDKFAKATNRDFPLDNGWGRGNRPVINVSWYDAKAYTVWLTEQTGQRYRLPTEIEWEYSIRAESNLSYWYGNEVKKGYSVCDECGSEWDGISTAPVGSQISNPFGLFDMHGNVAEWVEDCYHDSYEDAPTENIIWLASPCSKRVLRGGSWFDIPRVGRSSTRYPADPSLKASNWGFRVVRVISQKI